MGLITAAINAVTGMLESQWKEYFYCDAMPESVLATKAMKKKKSAFGFKVEDGSCRHKDGRNHLCQKKKRRCDEVPLCA